MQTNHITRFEKSCAVCGDKFIFVSNSPLLKLMYENEAWKVETLIPHGKTHQDELVNAARRI